MRGKRIARLAAMFAVCLVLLVLGVGRITNVMSEIMQNDMINQLVAVNENSLKTIQRRVQTDLQELQGLAEAISALGGPESPQALAFITRDVWRQQDTRTILSNVNGTSHSNDGLTMDIGQEDIFIQAMQGNVSFSQLRATMMNPKGDQEGFVLMVPVKMGTTVVGTLAMSRPAKHYQGLLSFSMLETAGSGYLVKASGEILLRSQDAAEAVDFTKESALLEQMQVGGVGSMQIDAQGGSYYLAFTPTKINNWYLIDQLDSNVLQAQKLVLRQVAATVAALAALLFLLLLGVIFVTEERKSKLMERMALYNQLTGLHNWQYLQNQFSALTAQGQLVYFVLRIQNFLRVSNVFGYAVIARYLKEMATLLRDEIKEGEAAIHAAEDCFVLLLKSKGSKEKDEQRLHMIITQLEHIILTDGNVVYDYRCVHVGGACMVDPEAKSLPEVSRRGNSIMESRLKAHAKSWGWYEPGPGDQLSLQESLIPDLLPALKEDGFIPFFQPQFDLDSGEIIGAEVLARWRHPVHGILLPGVFVPILEASGCVLELDMIMLEQACKMIQGWLAQGLYPVPMSINISRLNLHRRDLLDRIIDTAKRYGVPSNLIVLETTEAAVSDNSEKVLLLTRRLKEEGFLISIDDFGSESASFSMMKEIPLDVVKLSRSFLLQFQTGDRARTILHHVVDMLHELNAEIVAEGVENAEQEAVVRATGCNRVQGFYYSKPLAADEFEKLLFADNQE